MKKFMISIGYNNDFVIEPEDAIKLLEIAARAIRVIREGYSGPYSTAKDQDPLIDKAELVDFDPPKPKSDDRSLHLIAAVNLP